MKKLVMIRTTNNLHVIGYKNVFKNLLNRKRVLLEDPYFVDFIWNGQGQVEKVYMNTMRLIYAKNSCSLNARHVLFEVEPDAELVEIYNSMLEAVKQSKTSSDLL